MGRPSAKDNFSRVMLDKFVRAHPGAFFPKDSPDTKPLKTGILGDLWAAHPTLSRRCIRDFLHVYTNKNRYLRALLTIGERVDLAGEVCGVVSEDHRAHAQAQLDGRQAKRVAAIEAAHA